MKIYENKQKFACFLLRLNIDRRDYYFRGSVCVFYIVGKNYNYNLYSPLKQWLINYSKICANKITPHLRIDSSCAHCIQFSKSGKQFPSFHATLSNFGYFFGCYFHTLVRDYFVKGRIWPYWQLEASNSKWWNTLFWLGNYLGAAHLSSIGLVHLNERLVS